MRLRNEYLFFVLLALFALGIVVFEELAQATPEATPTSAPAVATPAAAVVREVLTETEPATAPGEVFQLVRYTIPPDLALAPHTHPGIQMNMIEAGTLTYYVVADGEIEVTRADGTVELIGPGESTTFDAGDAFVEPAGIVHYGANLGAEPVVILTASLLADDEPPSTVVELATPAASE
jgi:quercetin dioxygenase-like cupin family protein